MSWKKRTINLSRIDDLVALLKDNNINYKLSIISKVQGKGINDILKQDEKRIYVLRRLDYKEKVVMEKIIKNNDRDLDDFILSCCFVKSEIGDKWYYNQQK